MCSRSARFIVGENPPAFVLGHDDGKRAALPHPLPLFAAVFERCQHAGQPAGPDQVEPFGQRVLRLNRVTRIAEEPFDPGHHPVQLRRIGAQLPGDDPVHLEAALVYHLVPVHGAGLTQRTRRRNRGVGARTATSAA